MADPTKHLQINGGTLISDIKSVFSVLRTRRTVAFAYGFVFAFVAFTAFLAFNPSSTNSSSPWFTNIFSISSSTTRSSNISGSVNDSNRSHFSSIFSYLFPNSSQPQQSQQQPQQKQVHNFTSIPTQNNTAGSNKAPGKSSGIGDQLGNGRNESKGEVLKTNQTRIEAPKTPVSTNGKTQNGEALKLNRTTIQAPKSQESPNPKNQSNGEVLKQNQTAIQAGKSPVLQNQKGNLAKHSSLSDNSGKDEKVVGEKGRTSNYTSSLSKKQSNESNSGVSAKQEKEDMIESLIKCNFFDGHWVKDDSHPLYKPGSCSLIDEQFNCFLNGRPDRVYQKLKWKPKGCTLPRLNANHMLELLRGKRLVFVGDSLNRNMWESLVCILKNAVKDQSKVYEATGRHHFRTEASYSFIFKDYNCTVEFFVSPFLVQEWDMPEGNGTTKETLRLDLIGRSSDKYKDADFIIFNTGHWWTHDKTAKGKDYYQEGSHVYGQLNVIDAFRKALTTWAKWVDAKVNPKKTMVFFRGYSASHFSGGQWNSGGQCDSETEPIKNETYLSAYPPKMTVLESVLNGMKTHVSYLNITRMTDYRKDGHPSIYRKRNLSPEERKSPLRFQDCSHWCLPGVPDAWNEILYAELLVRRSQMQQQQRQKQKRP